MPLTAADFDLVADEDADPIFGNSKISRGRWRSQGRGPPFIKIGRKIFYRREKLADWLRNRESNSTAESKQKIRGIHDGDDG